MIDHFLLAQLFTRLDTASEPTAATKTNAPQPHTSHLPGLPLQPRIAKGEGTAMTIFDSPRGRVVGANGGSAIRLIGLGIAAVLLVIVLFNSVTRVGTGHVGV